MLWPMTKGSVVSYTMDDRSSSFDEYGGWMSKEMERNVQGKGIFVGHFISPV